MQQGVGQHELGGRHPFARTTPGPRHAPSLAGGKTAAQPAAGPIPQRSVQRVPRRPLRTIVAAMLGFVAGVAFWHFVGFWTFVREAVFKPDRNIAVSEDWAPPPIHAVRRDKLPTTLIGSIPAIEPPAGGQPCTTLRLDRTISRTTTQPCEGSPPPLAASAVGRSAPTPAAPLPRIPHVAGWATTIREQAPVD